MWGGVGLCHGVGVRGEGVLRPASSPLSLPPPHPYPPPLSPLSLPYPLTLQFPLVPSISHCCVLQNLIQAKHAFEQLREEIRNRNAEDINMLRISLDAQIEGKAMATLNIVLFYGAITHHVLCFHGTLCCSIRHLTVLCNTTMACTVCRWTAHYILIHSLLKDNTLSSAAVDCFILYCTVRCLYL